MFLFTLPDHFILQHLSHTISNLYTHTHILFWPFIDKKIFSRFKIDFFIYKYLEASCQLKEDWVIDACGNRVLFTYIFINTLPVRMDIDRRRQLVLQEFVQTEQNYLRDLHILSSNFFTPLKVLPHPFSLPPPPFFWGVKFERVQCLSNF